MKSTYRTFVLHFLVFLLFPVLLKAQDYSTKDKKAIKYFEEGNVFFDKGEMAVAESSFQNAVTRDDNFIEAHMLLAYVYIETDRNEDAIQKLEKAISIDPRFYPAIYYNLGQLYMNEENYYKSSTYFKTFLSFLGQNPALKQDAKLQVRNCEFSLNAIKNPVHFEPINMGPSINSDKNEYFPCMTADGSMFLYTRQLPSTENVMGFNEDFYVSFADDQGNWMPSKNLGKPINTPNNEGAPTLSADGQLLIFTACPLYGEYGSGRKGMGRCDLFASRRIGNNWTPPKNLGPPINTSRWESQPSFSADGKTLYFVRGWTNKNGIKVQDIYMAEHGDNGWSKPKPLNDNVNTDGIEESVFIHPDGQTLYFSSNGHVGLGGLDLYYSKKDEFGNWGKAVNLGYPINTSNDENSLLVDPNGQYAYFASNREGGLGGLDLYKFELPESVRPVFVSFVKGLVIDKYTRKPVDARFELIDLETGDIMIESYANEGNGEFLVTLPSNRNYALNVSKKGYLFHSENFTLKANKDGNARKELNIEMVPIKEGEKVVLNNIFFETSKYDLKEESQVELNKLVNFLKSNIEVGIEIGGHTDNVGSETDNQKLSESRAKSVYDYLVENEIASERLSYKGYGEQEPLADNSTDEGKAANRRTEFKIIQL